MARKAHLGGLTQGIGASFGGRYCVPTRPFDMAVVFSRRESRQNRRNLNGGLVPDHGAFKNAAGSGTWPCDTREIHRSLPESPPGQG